MFSFVYNQLKLRIFSLDWAFYIYTCMDSVMLHSHVSTVGQSGQKLSIDSGSAFRLFCIFSSQHMGR